MTALHFVYITMDGNQNTALREAAELFEQEYGLQMRLSLYDAANLRDEADWERLEADVNHADFVFGCMIFGEEHVRPLDRILKEAERPTCVITSNPTLIYRTRLNNFVLTPPSEQEPEEPGPLKRWMQKLRPKKDGKKEGHRQTNLVMNLTKLMKYVPGKMRDLHTFISMHEFWLHSSPENLKRMMALLTARYVPRIEQKLPIKDPVKYPDAAIYHPDAPAPFPDVASYQKWRRQQGKPVAVKDHNGTWQGSVGLLTMRAIVLSNNTPHLDGLIRAIEAQGLEARAVYSAMLDFRPAMQHFFGKDLDGTEAASKGELPPVDLVVNTMGFPLVGGPAGSDAEKAVEALKQSDVPYYAYIPLGFQRVEDWQADEIGLNPMQVALNIALPELDGSAEPVVFGGPSAKQPEFMSLTAEVENAATRMARRIRMKQKSNAEKKLAVVLFNFPPNLGNAGTAAFLDVFASVYRLLNELREQGHTVDLPASADDLRNHVVSGNAMQYGTDGNVVSTLSLDDYRRLFPWYPEIEEYWGYAPGELLTNGRDFYILGAQFGNVFVGIQPSFGYERDPMRLLMGKDASPHHGFAAFYTWLNHIYDADAVVHFGTHGALEFMPGKQNGVGMDCWPRRLLGALPNFYYYCVNNPSEGSIAKRRGAATTVSYMVPPLQQAGLYKGLRRLKDSLDNYNKRPDEQLLEDIRTQADKLGIVLDETQYDTANMDDSAYVAALGHELIQVEHRMIPLGLHMLGEAPTHNELVDILSMAAAFNPAKHPERDENLPTLPQLLARGLGWDYKRLQGSLKNDPVAQEHWEHIENLMHEAMSRFVTARTNAPVDAPLDASEADAYLESAANVPAGLLVNLWHWLDDLMYRIIHDQELEGLLHSLDGGYIAPSPGNDVVRNDAIVPTGRNIHALDPYRIPSQLAMNNAQALTRQMLERLTKQQGEMPETVAMVLWGTDNLKSDGEGIAQCLVLLGARPVEDELGNISDVELIPLEELERPRIDLVITVSGIFRDLFHHQAGLLDKAVRMAAAADEPSEQNFVRKHTDEHVEALGITHDEAAARVYSNAPGAYGAHVNHLVESSTWEEDEQLSEAFMNRKSYAYTPGGNWKASREVMERSLGTVEAAFQNIDSFELGISDVDHYYEYLGGVTKSVEKAGGKRPPVMVADAVALDDRLSSLEQMVRLESRAKLLNPKWYESMMNHGYEGVREIELRVSNTYGWSATADAVEDWVYDDVAETFMLDEEMRRRMAEANPHATAAIARRLLEAESRGFWDASDEMIDKLREIYGNLEDEMEGIHVS